MSSVKSAEVRKHLVGAKSMAATLYKAKVAYAVKGANALGVAVPPVVESEAKRLGIPLNVDDEFDEFAKGLVRCRNGHYMPLPKVHLDDTNRATYCTPCDQWLVWQPTDPKSGRKLVSDREIRAQIKRLEWHRTMSKVDRKRRAQQTAKDAKTYLRAIGRDVPTEAELAAELARIEASRRVEEDGRRVHDRRPGAHAPRSFRGLVIAVHSEATPGQTITVRCTNPECEFYGTGVSVTVERHVRHGKPYGSSGSDLMCSACTAAVEEVRSST